MDVDGGNAPGAGANSRSGSSCAEDCHTDQHPNPSTDLAGQNQGLKSAEGRKVTALAFEGGSQRHRRHNVLLQGATRPSRWDEHMPGRSPGSRVIVLHRPSLCVGTSDVFGGHFPHTVAGAASASDVRFESVLSEFPLRFPTLCAVVENQALALWISHFEKYSRRLPHGPSCSQVSGAHRPDAMIAV